ncbi:MAG: ABC transporter permease [Candidatus Pacebacteria bacterium]|nr:ABC transporter permease [Candidatus Paceibacterota bacterium]
MTLGNTIKTSLRGLAAHKGRSVLTILGVVIGVTAIILVMSIGQSAQNLILNQIQGLGSKMIIVLPGREPEGISDMTTLFADSLKEKDLEALKKKGNVPFAEDVMPLAFGGGSLSYLNEVYSATVMGVGDKEEDGIVEKVLNFTVDRGFFFTAEDVRAKASVAVVGDKVVEELFGKGAEPIGEKIKINGRNFKIIGLLPAKGQVGMFDLDGAVLIPYTTAQDYIFGKKNIDRIIINATEEELVDRTVDDIKITIRNNHGILDTEKDDFYIETQIDIMEKVSTITSILSILLTSIAAISLVVGGVGIMNIMLVAVTERTREIGLRKAIGATNKDILTQFLLDAVFLTVIGGIIGIILGASFSFLASFFVTNFYGLDFAFIFPVSAAILGIGVSAGIGLLFGIYPARQASKKSPIEALRYE